MSLWFFLVFQTLYCGLWARQKIIYRTSEYNTKERGALQLRHTVNCLPNEDCSVGCLTDHSCYAPTINGPVNKSLIIICRGEAACHSIYIHAEQSSNLYINVYNYHHGLVSARIYAPNYGNTYIKCGITNSNISLTDPGRVCGYDNGIYSINGFDKVAWTYYKQNSWALFENQTSSPQRYNHMYCGDSYKYFCGNFTIKNKKYNCADNRSICYTTYGLTFPTTTSNHSTSYSENVFNSELHDQTNNFIVLIVCFAVVLFSIFIGLLYCYWKSTKRPNADDNHEQGEYEYENVIVAKGNVIGNVQPNKAEPGAAGNKVSQSEVSSMQVEGH